MTRHFPNSFFAQKLYNFSKLLKKNRAEKLFKIIKNKKQKIYLQNQLFSINFARNNNERMGNWSQQQELKKETKEKDKVRKEKLAGYFLNLSQLTFVALVLGGITPLYTDTEITTNWFIIGPGSILTFIFAAVGNKILK